MALVPDINVIQKNINQQLAYIYNSYGVILQLIYKNTNQYNNTNTQIATFTPNTSYLIPSVKTLYTSQINNLTYQVISDVLNNFANYIETAIYYMRNNNVDSQFSDTILQYKESVIAIADYANACLSQNNLISKIYTVPRDMSFRQILFLNNKDVSSDYEANIALNPDISNPMWIKEGSQVRLYRQQGNPT